MKSPRYTTPGKNNKTPVKNRVLPRFSNKSMSSTNQSKNQVLFFGIMNINSTMNAKISTVWGPIMLTF